MPARVSRSQALARFLEAQIETTGVRLRRNEELVRQFGESRHAPIIRSEDRAAAEGAAAGSAGVVMQMRAEQQREATARMAALKVGQPFAFTSDALPGRPFSGKVSYINPAADEASRTVKVKAEVPITLPRPLFFPKIGRGASFPTKA